MNLHFVYRSFVIVRCCELKIVFLNDVARFTVMYIPNKSILFVQGQRRLILTDTKYNVVSVSNTVVSQNSKS